MTQCSERGFSLKAAHQTVAVELGHAELQLGPDDGHARERSVSGVELEQGIEVDVRESVGVGRAERLLVQSRLKQLDPATGRSLDARVHALDRHPRRPGDCACVVLDHRAAIPGRQQEPREPLRGVHPDHVPDDRLAADLHERLGDLARVLLQARAASAAQDHDGWAAPFLVQGAGHLSVPIGDRLPARGWIHISDNSNDGRRLPA